MGSGTSHAENGFPACAPNARFEAKRKFREK